MAVLPFPNPEPLNFPSTSLLLLVGLLALA